MELFCQRFLHVCQFQSPRTLNTPYYIQKGTFYQIRFKKLEFKKFEFSTELLYFTSWKWVGEVVGLFAVFEILMLARQCSESHCSEIWATEHICCGIHAIWLLWSTHIFVILSLLHILLDFHFERINTLMKNSDWLFVGCKCFFRLFYSEDVRQAVYRFAKIDWKRLKLTENDSNGLKMTKIDWKQLKIT